MTAAAIAMHHHQHCDFGIGHAIDRRNVGEIGNQRDNEGDRRESAEDCRGMVSNKLQQTRVEQTRELKAVVAVSAARKLGESETALADPEDKCE